MVTPVSKKLSLCSLHFLLNRQYPLKEVLKRRRPKSLRNFQRKFQKTVPFQFSKLRVISLQLTRTELCHRFFPRESSIRKKYGAVILFCGESGNTQDQGNEMMKTSRLLSEYFHQAWWRFQLLLKKINFPVIMFYSTRCNKVFKVNNKNTRME